MILYKQTVVPETWQLLVSLMQITELKQFVLVGGTNLSLQLGHRVSVDLDLFTNTPFDLEAAKNAIEKTFPETIIHGTHKQSIWMQVKGVKIDLILHEYPYVNEPFTDEGVRFLAIEDIIPMKLEAAAGRGVKKDFWDLAYLLDSYSLKEMLKFHQKKYQQHEPSYILRSLTYFDDAEKESVDPMDLHGRSWKEIKNVIQKAVKDYFSLH